MRFSQRRHDLVHVEQLRNHRELGTRRRDRHAHGVGAVQGRGQERLGQRDRLHPRLPHRIPVTHAARGLGAGAALLAKTTMAAGVPVKLTWAAATDDTGVARYELQQSIAAGAWAAVRLPTRRADRDGHGRPGNVNQFRVRAIDPAGNASAWAAGAKFRATHLQETAAGSVYAGTWKAAKVAGASGGTLKYATTAPASVKRSVNGKSVAIVSGIGPDRGKARISVDGAIVATVDLYAAAAKLHQVVSVVNLTPGAHTVEVKVLGTKNAASTGTRVDFDAFVVLN